LRGKKSLLLTKNKKREKASPHRAVREGGDRPKSWLMHCERNHLKEKRKKRKRVRIPAPKEKKNGRKRKKAGSCRR